ncbi:MAG: signal recognition particle receptor subunit alpha [Candidatus Heimdallarchaeum aukensis]|uniref:Signal recognition particle 54 kDa protein n=1 Tax=Candidatus Heimdallarchaeum aukensis TaxID=2876573 RepID=A0A9Y1BIP6_9ARCH|nr:MAG: signal recognition particle receptor subunit alpha [Candidatus Heimdallarchaeum aukensis]
MIKMLGTLGSKLHKAISNFISGGVADKEAIKQLKNEMLRALLESDVDFEIANKVVSEVEKKSLEKELPDGLSRKKSVISIIHDELVAILGKKHYPITINHDKPTIIMLIGIQGSGKTTTTAKIAKYIKKRGKKVAVVTADNWRPGAYEQLQQLCSQIDVPVYGDPENKRTVKIAQTGIKKFLNEKYNYIILDTAGRHKEEKDLLNEMNDLYSKIKPDEVILVIDGNLGQTAYKQAKAFAEKTPVGSIIVTKLDGSAKGGGALSAAAAAKVPIKFIGNGETIDDLEEFNPTSFVGRLLGLGDIEGLLKEVKELEGLPSKEQALDMLSGKITFRQMMELLGQFSKMGSMKRMLSMIPGLGMTLTDDMLDISKENMKKFEVIMNSMTDKELDNKVKLNQSRINRIARGSGRSHAEVKELINQHKMVSQMMKKMKKSRRGGLQIPGFPPGMFG